jgi:hypothetical protein
VNSPILFLDMPDLGRFLHTHGTYGINHGASHKRPSIDGWVGLVSQYSPRLARLLSDVQWL